MTDISLTYEGAFTANEDVIAKNALTVLHRNFPGHEWGIAIDKALLTVKNKRFGQWGYRINMLLHTDSRLYNEVYIAGAECLERFCQPRGKIDVDKINSQPRDARGVMVPDRG